MSSVLCNSKETDLARIPLAQVPKQAISRLLSTVLGHEVAWSYNSRLRGDVASELAAIFGQIRQGDFKYQHYRLLSLLVIKTALRC